MLIVRKSLFISLCDVYLSEAMENRNMSSANILQADCMLLGKSLIKLKIMKGPRTNPYGTPDFINFQEEVFPLKSTVS